jgi:hypothetical protein
MMRETVSTIAEDDVCCTCGQTYGWHLEHKPIHPYNTGEAGAKALLGARRVRDPQSAGSTSQRGPQAPPTVVWPTDPVLRVALINAGVITADDLRKAEDMLKASMGLEGGPNGKSPEGTWGRQVQE